MKHLSEEDLVLLYYDEPGVVEGSKTALVHLAECADCRGAAEALAQTLDACNEWSPPAADAELGRTVWARLAPQLDSRTAGTPLGWEALLADGRSGCGAGHCCLLRGTK